MNENNKAYQQSVKESNMRVVFRLIHRNKMISRADIKKITLLSASTVSSLVEELIDDGFVTECGIKKTKSCGRKPVMLKINGDGGCFLSLDIQRKHITFEAFTLDYTLISSFSVDFSDSDNLSEVIIKALNDICKKHRILAITIGVPGVIDPVNNTLISSTVLSLENAKGLYLNISSAFKDIRVFLKNNSGLIALAEKEFGTHKETNNIVSIDINDGVGAGVLIDSSIYDGNGVAGEFGHMSIDFMGKKCKCGGFGCLELYAGVPAILEQSGFRSVDELSEYLNTTQDYSKLQTTAKALAFGINNIVNLLDPEVIVIGGKVRMLGDAFLALVKQYYSSIAFIKKKTIEFSSITGNPVTMGAAKYSFDMLFGD